MLVKIAEGVWIDPTLVESVHSGHEDEDGTVFLKNAMGEPVCRVFIRGSEYVYAADASADDVVQRINRALEAKL